LVTGLLALGTVTKIRCAQSRSGNNGIVSVERRSAKSNENYYLGIGIELQYHHNSLDLFYREGNPSGMEMQALFLDSLLSILSTRDARQMRWRH